MSWIRIDDNMADHPKVLGFGQLAPLAIALQIRALCWSSRFLTDGKIPAEAIPRLLAGFAECSRELRTKFATRRAAKGVEWPTMMVRAGLWDEIPNQGYMIHDYLQYNPSRAQVLAAREAARERMHRVRNSSQNVQPNITGTSREVRESPSPSPSPTTKSKALLAHAKGARAPLDAEFELAWSAYPKRGGNNPKQDALHAWRARLKAGIPPGTMLAGVERYAKYCVSTGWVGSRYVMQARRFFGPSQQFAETWEVPVDPDAWKRDPFAFRPGETQEAYIRRTSEGNGR